jgi:beta-galactosidase
MRCLKPGNTALEALLVETALGATRAPFACDGALVYRQASPAADHYFLVNDGPATRVALDTKVFAYTAAVDAVTDEPIDLSAIDIDGHSGRWVRCAK